MMMASKEIYILLTQTGTLFSKTIKAYTGEPFSHVSIAFDIELKEIYSFGRKKPNNPLIAGFVAENISSGTFAKYSNTTCAVFSLTVNLEQYEQIRDVIKYFSLRSDNYRYNLLGLIGIIMGYPIERENTYFCSQFVATVLKKSGISIFDKSPGLVTPSDFRRSEHLNLIYSGKLRNYNNYTSYSIGQALV
jgi:hypothetical protein